MAETVFQSGNPSLDASWSNGLPNATNIAVWNNTSAACTLTAPLNAGVKILPTYAAAFSQAGQKITTPAGQPFHAIKGVSSTITLNGEIEINGVDFMAYQAAMAGATVQVNSVIDWWFQPDNTNNYLLKTASAAGSKISVRNGTDGIYGQNFSSAFCFIARNQDFAGEIDFSNISVNVTAFMHTTLIFRSTARIVNTSTVRNAIWYSPNVSPTVTVEPGATVVKDRANAVDLASWYASNVQLNAGDYRGFRLQMASGAAKFTLLGIRTTIKDFNFISSLTSPGGFYQAAGNVAEFVGDVIPLYPGLVPQRMEIAGTNDQTVDLAKATNTDPISFSSAKSAGNVSLLAGSFLQADDSAIGGTFNLAALTGSYDSAGHDLEFNGIVYPASGATISFKYSQIANSGSVDWNGNASLEITRYATWTQRGGTEAAPNLWKDSAYRLRRFGKLVYDAGSWTKIVNSGSKTFETQSDTTPTILVNGTIELNAGYDCSTGSNLRVSETGRIFSRNGSTIFFNTGAAAGPGHSIVDVAGNIEVPILANNSNITLSGIFNVPVETYSAGTSSIAVSFVAVSFLQNVSVGCTGTGATAALTATLDDASFAADLTTKKALDAQTVTIIGPITATGNRDQAIDLAAVASVSTVLFDKSSGNAVITVSSTGVETDHKLNTGGTSGGNAYFAGVGTVKLVADFAVAGYDHDATIIFEPAEFAVTERPIYRATGYVVATFAANKNQGPFTLTTRDLVQDATRIDSSAEADFSA